MPGSLNPERATPILGLCHGVFMSCFRHILGFYFPAKIGSECRIQRIRNIRSQKGKLGVIKRQQILFLGL